MPCSTIRIRGDLSYSVKIVFAQPTVTAGRQIPRKVGYHQIHQSFAQLFLVIASDIPIYRTVT